MLEDITQLLSDFITKLPWWFPAAMILLGLCVIIIKFRVKKETVFSQGVQSKPFFDTPIAEEGTTTNPASETTTPPEEKQSQVERPTIEPPNFNGSTNQLDKAMEYILSTALINSAPYMRFKGSISFETKFGKHEIVYDDKQAEPPRKEEIATASSQSGKALQTSEQPPAPMSEESEKAE